MPRRDLAHDFLHRADLAYELEGLLGVLADVLLLHAELPLPQLWEIQSCPTLLLARARDWILESASATHRNRRVDRNTPRGAREVRGPRDLSFGATGRSGGGGARALAGSPRRWCRLAF